MQGPQRVDTNLDIIKHTSGYSKNDLESPRKKRTSSMREKGVSLETEETKESTLFSRLTHSSTLNWKRISTSFPSFDAQVTTPEVSCTYCSSKNKTYQRIQKKKVKSLINQVIFNHKREDAIEELKRLSLEDSSSSEKKRTKRLPRTHKRSLSGGALLRRFGKEACEKDEIERPSVQKMEEKKTAYSQEGFLEFLQRKNYEEEIEQLTEKERCLLSERIENTFKELKDLLSKNKACDESNEHIFKTTKKRIDKQKCPKEEKLANIEKVQLAFENVQKRLQVLQDEEFLFLLVDGTEIDRTQIALTFGSVISSANLLLLLYDYLRENELCEIHLLNIAYFVLFLARNNTETNFFEKNNTIPFNLIIEELEKQPLSSHNDISKVLEQLHALISQSRNSVSFQRKVAISLEDASKKVSSFLRQVISISKKSKTLIEECAKNLFQLNSRLYSDLIPYDLVRVNNKEKNMPRVDFIIRVYNNFSMHFVVKSILEQEELINRACLIRFYIDLSKKCLKMNDLVASYTIYNALVHSSIGRLHSSFDTAFQEKGYKEKYQKIEEFFTVAGNFPNVRKLIREKRSSSSFVIPPIAIFLKDILFAEEVSPIVGYATKRSYNYNKIKDVYELIQDFLSFQLKVKEHSKRIFKQKFKNNHIARYLLQDPSLFSQIEDELYELSQKIEP